MKPYESLLLWYQKSKRDLPFRKKKHFYPIWVSEVMLQQTRVAAMLPLFEAFLEQFPSVFDLAKAPEEKVLAAWKGLGYYSRARNLKKAALYLVQNYAGNFPRTLEEALAVPGIGPYTGRAVLSIAFNLPYAVLDGNVKRVLSRVYGYTEDISTPQANLDLQTLADQFLHPSLPGDHNQAMMELGASLCAPKQPKCLLCPLVSFCLAYQKQLTDQIPKKAEKRTPVEVFGKLFLLWDSGKIFLVQDTQARFFAKFPHLPLVWTPPLPWEEKSDLFPFLEILGKISNPSSIGRFRHSITHHKLEFELYLLKPPFPTLPSSGFWVEERKVEEVFPSSIVTKALDLFRKL